MKSDLLDKARAELSLCAREHASTVHQAHATVVASKKRYEAAKKRVMDLEFAAVAAEVATNKERALQRR